MIEAKNDSFLRPEINFLQKFSRNVNRLKFYGAIFHWRCNSRNVYLLLEALSARRKKSVFDCEVDYKNNKRNFIYFQSGESSQVFVSIAFQAAIVAEASELFPVGLKQERIKGEAQAEIDFRFNKTKGKHEAVP